MSAALVRFWRWLSRVDTPAIWPQVFGTDSPHAWLRELRSDE